MSATGAGHGWTEHEEQHTHLSDRERAAELCGEGSTAPDAMIELAEISYREQNRKRSIGEGE